MFGDAFGKRKRTLSFSVGEHGACRLRHILVESPFCRIGREGAQPVLARSVGLSI
jgi:hypothetical protein